MSPPQSPARFWRCDLQVHSPLEPEFKPGVDRKQPKKITDAAERYVGAALKAELDAIAITEHNSVEFLPHLQAAAKDRLVVFPGAEVSTADGYHVLCIFNPGTSADEIQAFLNKLGIERGNERYDDGKVRSCDTGWTFGAILKEVERRKGLCIAPHVRRKKGLLHRAASGDIRVRAWTDPHLLAVEDDRVDLKAGTFADDCMLNRRDDYHRERVPARVWGSDAKSYDEIGSSQSYIKMAELSVEGLRQAFLDPGSRIRHPERYDLTSRDRIVSIRWDGGFLGGEELIPAEQLTCLIGGKGTGKSTVVESLRFAFDVEAPAGLGKAQYDKLVQNALPPGTRVDVELELRDGTGYSLTRTAGRKPELRDADGNPVELNPQDVFDLAVYSQGQILETARQPQAHLGLLDSFIEASLSELRREEQTVLDALQGNRKQLAAALAQEETHAQDDARIRHLEEARKAFEKKGVSARTEQRRQLDREERLVEVTLEKLDELRSVVAELEAFATKPDLLTEKLPHAKVWKELSPDWDALAGKAAAFRTEALSAITALEKQLKETQAPDSDWSRSVREKREEVARIYRELQEEYPDLDLAQFERIDRELDDLRLKAGDPKALASRIVELRKRRKKLLADLTEIRRKQYRTRDELATHLTNTLDGAVRVEVDFEGHRQVLADELASLKTGVKGDALRDLAEHSDCTPEALGEALLEGVDTIEKKFGLTAAQATGLVDRIDLEGKFRIQEFALPDHVTIEFNLAEPKETPRYRDLTRLSVGQKATSILLILLAQDRKPLVIDQPEDDLDNRFIFNDVVGRLRDAKDQRQLLLATHNANIPVLGDAELIVVLEAEESAGKPTGRIEDAGSIDSNSIKRAVTLILEGGREAFRKRQEKYGLPIPEDV